MEVTSRRNFLRTLSWTATALWASPLLRATATRRQGNRLNVLMIPVDDLRCQLGCCGFEQIVSPNIDQLAATGTIFRRAYTMVATCSPSRTSLMTGCRASLRPRHPLSRDPAGCSDIDAAFYEARLRSRWYGQGLPRQPQ